MAMKLGSRISRRAGTKSAIRLYCQRQTAGARNRARKSMQGRMRIDEDKLATKPRMRKMFGDDDDYKLLFFDTH